MRPIGVIIAVSALLLCTLVTVPCDSSADGSGAVVDGYVQIGGKFAASDELVITLYYPSVNETYLTRTAIGLDDKGHFSIDSIPEVRISGCLMSFNVNGYSVDLVSSSFDEDADTTTIKGDTCYRFSEDKYGADTFMPGETYTVGSNGSKDRIEMKAYTGILTGKVFTASATPVALNGATVSVMEEDGKVVARGNTNGGGVFTIECPTGYYSMSVDMSGYDKYTMNVIIGKGTTTDVKEIDLTVREGAFGMDVQHVLAIAGGVIALIVAAIGLYLYHRSRSGRTSIICNKRTEE